MHMHASNGLGERLDGNVSAFSICLPLPHVLGSMYHLQCRRSLDAAKNPLEPPPPPPLLYPFSNFGLEDVVGMLSDF